PASAKATPPKAAPKKKAPASVKARVTKPEPVKLTPFLEKQRQRLLILKDTLLDSMSGVARDSLRTEGETSAFGMHQADAGSDAYDRDFALSLLSQEQDSLYEIDQALKRIELGGYGVCEMSNKPIPKARLEALPFTRFTVECQAEIEKRDRYSKYRQQPVSLFGSNEEDGEGDDEDNLTDSKD
ncbi:MAG: TraR/DksA family transcriptional regulator, partial [Chthoniobacterales bacterium]